MRVTRDDKKMLVKHKQKAARGGIHGQGSINLSINGNNNTFANTNTNTNTNIGTLK